MSFRSIDKKRSAVPEDDKNGEMVTGRGPRRPSVVHSSFVRIHKGRNTVSCYQY